MRNASAKNRMSMIPSQKSGMEVPNRPSNIELRSAMPPGLIAALMPRGTAISTAMANESRVNSIVTGRRTLSKFVTASLLRKSLPRSPCNSLPSHCPYCRWMGRSKPSSSRTIASRSGVARNPRMTAAGSPGIRRRSREIRTDVPSRTGNKSRRRPAM